MGLKKYPDHSCRLTQCIFSSRVDLVLYEEALEIAQIMDMALDANDMSKVEKSIEICKGGF
jgi:Fanconi-associated nuclease 1